MSRSSKPSPLTSPALLTETPLESVASAPKIVIPAAPGVARSINVGRDAPPKIT